MISKPVDRSLRGIPFRSAKPRSRQSASLRLKVVPAFSLEVGQWIPLLSRACEPLLPAQLSNVFYQLVFIKQDRVDKIGEDSIEQSVDRLGLVKEAYKGDDFFA